MSDVGVKMHTVQQILEFFGHKNWAFRQHFSPAGRFIGAKEAMAWGLVNRVLPPQQLMPHCLDLAKEMSKMQLDDPRGRLWQW